MSEFLFSNNAQTTLAGAITSVALTAQLAAGSGVEFPSPGAGQLFCMTFVDAATGLINEIVHVTNVTGDVITMVRAQEGTTARGWLAGDFAANFLTAGSMAAMAQTGQLNNTETVTGAGAVVLPVGFVGEVILNKAAPQTTLLTLPPDPSINDIVLITDGALNAFTYNDTAQTSDGSTIIGVKILAADGGQIRFKYFETGVWLGTLMAP